jgi:xanthine dehydrogenase large subunit
MSEAPSIQTQAQLAALFAQGLSSGVGRSVKHDSADKHVTGEAVYIDDRLEFPNQLHVYARLSDRAHARILRIDTAPCYAIAGVRLAITHEDIPGLKDIGALLPGDPLLAIDRVEFVGQPVLAVAACDLDTARRAAMAAVIEYEDLEPVLDVVEALRKRHFVLDSHTHQRGDCATALADAPHRLQGQLHIGGQEHFYLETQISSVMPTEDGGMIVYCSTQNPTEVQKLVAEVLDVAMHKVVVDMRRMGGGFGGKETQAASPACLCAVVAHLTGQPTKMRLPRVEDMLMTGKRHPSISNTTLALTTRANCAASPLNWRPTAATRPTSRPRLSTVRCSMPTMPITWATPPCMATVARPTLRPIRHTAALEARKGWSPSRK